MACTFNFQRKLRAGLRTHFGFGFPEASNREGLGSFTVEVPASRHLTPAATSGTLSQDEFWRSSLLLAGATGTHGFSLRQRQSAIGATGERDEGGVFHQG